MSDKDTPPLTGKDLARKPRGFPDKRESLIHAQAGLVETITGVYRQWGFEALETGAFEYADALGKFLPDDDRPCPSPSAATPPGRSGAMRNLARAASVSSGSAMPTRLARQAFTPMQK